uniref:ABC transporter permease n=1 Tax=Mesorhizobium sp. WSM4875 TaxID=3038539 RepID=UPI002417F5E9|nr:ABC transporter permease subunit [Mesorhizobium sp. WSM4875]WIE94827.1 ABC transporter permease subunit [Mesorhizobium sp. WSM4875]
MVDLFRLLSFGPEGWGSQLLSGAWLTIRLALTTLPFGMLLGLILAYAIISGRRLLAYPATIFTTVFRALPELLTIFIMYYGAQMLLDASLPDAHIEISGFWSGVVALGIVFASFSSEVFVAGLRALPKGQFEAAHALGLRPFATFFDVVLPQLIRLTLPGLGNLWLVLLKDTALVSVIALNDLMRQTSIAVSTTKQPLFFYAVVLVIYYLISLSSGRVVAVLESRANRGFEAAR